MIRDLGRGISARPRPSPSPHATRTPFPLATISALTYNATLLSTISGVFNYINNKNNNNNNNKILY